MQFSRWKYFRLEIIWPVTTFCRVYKNQLVFEMIGFRKIVEKCKIMFSLACFANYHEIAETSVLNYLGLLQRPFQRYNITMYVNLIIFLALWFMREIDFGERTDFETLNSTILISRKNWVTEKVCNKLRRKLTAGSFF